MQLSRFQQAYHVFELMDFLDHAENHVAAKLLQHGDALCLSPLNDT